MYASSSSAVTGYNYPGAGVKEAEAPNEGACEVWQRSWVRGKYMLQMCCVWVHISEQGPWGGESIPAPGDIFNLVHAG